MGISLLLRRRARALRKRYLDPRFAPTRFGHPGPKVRAAAAPHEYPAQENQDLHATAKFFAEQARGVEKSMERNRWNRS